MEKNGQNQFTQIPEVKLRIKVINDKCISAATCVIIAPLTFDLDEEGIAFVKEGTWDEAITIIDAAKSCPTTAIIVEDMEGNRVYPIEND